MAELVRWGRKKDAELRDFFCQENQNFPERVADLCHIQACLKRKMRKKMDISVNSSTPRTSSNDSLTPPPPHRRNEVYSDWLKFTCE